MIIRKTSKISITDILCMAIFGLSLFAVTFLAITVGGFKLSLFRILVVIAFLLTILKSLKLNNYIICMAVWLAEALLSYLWCTDTTRWFQAVFFIFIAFALVLFYSYNIVNTGVFNKACVFFALLIGVHNFIAYREIATGVYRWADETKVYALIRDGSPTSVFSNPNNLATVLLFGITVLIICFMNSKIKIMRLLWGGLIISCIYLIVCTKSRANAIALIIGIIFYFLIGSKQSSKRVGFFVALMMIGGLLAISPVGDLIVSQFSDVVRIKVSEETLRVELLKTGWDCFIDSYGLGVGAGNLPNKIIDHMGALGGSLHFWWLEVLFTYGPIVFALYIYSYVKLLLTCINNSKRGSSI